MSDAPKPSSYLSPPGPFGVSITREPDGHLFFNQPVTRTDTLHVCPPRGGTQWGAVVEIVAHRHGYEQMRFLLTDEQRELLIDALRHPRNPVR